MQTTTVDAELAKLEAGSIKLQAMLEAKREAQATERNRIRDESISKVVDEFRAELNGIVNKEVFARLAQSDCAALMITAEGIVPILAQPAKALKQSGNRDLDAELIGKATPAQMDWLAEERRLKPRSGGMAHALKLRIIDDGDRTVPNGHGRIG